jgi:ferredoxin
MRETPGRFVAPGLTRHGTERYVRAPMPTVKFVVEHQVVQVEAGRKLRDIATEAGINVDREFFRGLNCRGLGLCGCCKVWVRAADAAALNAPNLRERFHGMGGGRRLACQARVNGDVVVTSMAGGDDRLTAGRNIDAAPGPVVDPKAPRKPIDEAASIAYPLGHPSAVGRGEVPEPKADGPKPKAAVAEKPKAAEAEKPKAAEAEKPKAAEAEKPAGGADAKGKTDEAAATAPDDASGDK